MMATVGSPSALAATAGLWLLSVAICLCFARLVIGPTLPDRVVALDMIATLLVGMFVLSGIEELRAESVRIAMALALLNFVGTIAFAAYVSRRDVR